LSQKHNLGLLAVAIFKLVKGLLLAVLAFGVHRLLHRDVQEVAEGWINALRVDPDNRYAGALLAKAGLIDDRKLEQLSILTALYAGLFLTEGGGLFMEKRWAEWLSVIATASFLPLEVYELAKHFSTLKVLLLTGNIVIVLFLIFLLRRGKTQEQH
jgi:uncharacterized membrane protein (DUF2068 family)